MLSFIRTAATAVGGKAVAMMSNPIVATIGATLVIVETIRVGTPVLKGAVNTIRSIGIDDVDTEEVPAGAPATPGLKVVSKKDEPKTEPVDQVTIRTLRQAAKKLKFEIPSDIKLKADIFKHVSQPVRDLALQLQTNPA